jgi:hypothetical protein
MAQQVINIGSAADDGTGDELRISFDKCNQNFTELYDVETGISEAPIDGNVYGRQDAGWTSCSAQFAPLASPIFTGNPTAPTPSAGDNDTSIATTAFVSTAITALVGTAGSGADTLGELEDQILLTNTAVADRAPIASPTFTGDPKAPTPATVDNDTSIATTAFVKAQGYLVSTDLASYAPLASPALTGNPTAPTPTAGDNDTSVATTAFVTTAIAGKADTSALTAKADLASPTFTGDPKAPTPAASDNDTSIATTAFVTAAVAAAGSGATTPGPPQGRLTLQSATPVMITTQAAKTTIFYPPYQGNLCPIYNGTTFSMSAFTELSALTTDTTKSPAAIGASKCNDWFVWNDAGTLRISHGPDWTDDTTRSAGTALVMVNGIRLNNASITNGPAAQRGTYVGTTRSNSSSQLDWIYGTTVANGGAGFFGVWNAYNRRQVASRSSDTTDSWSYGTAAWRPSNDSQTMRCSFVMGLAEDAYTGFFCSRVYASGSGACAIGVAVDSITAIANGATNVVTSSYQIWGLAQLLGNPVLGFHYVQAMEISSLGTAYFYGDDSGPGERENSLCFTGWM